MCKSCAAGGKPIACLLIRVSSPGQKDVSPETQLNETMPWLESLGYVVPHKYILSFDWGSQELLDCPEIDKFLGWAKNREVHGAGMYMLDRLAGSPNSIGVIYDTCQQHGVKLLPKDIPLPDGIAGEVLALIVSIAKKQAVVGNRPRIKDGMRDRAKIKKVPISGKPIYGYQYRYKWLTPMERVPDALDPKPAEYPTACQIWRMALAGVSLRRMCRTLIDEGIPTARGGQAWRPETIRGILDNPAYAGVYHALRKESVEPKSRKSPGYGKTSQRTRSTKDWIPLPDFKVVDPIVTPAQFEAVQRQLEANKQNSPRNAKRFYLLAGMLFCEEDGRRLVGTPNGSRGTYKYKCKARGGEAWGAPLCHCRRINGPKADEIVWLTVMGYLQNPERFARQIARQPGTDDGSEAEVRRRIETLQRKLRKVDAMDTELVSMKLRDGLSEEVYQRSLALNKAERAALKEALEDQRAVLATIEESKSALDALIALRDSLIEAGAEELALLPPQRRRWMLLKFNTRVIVDKDGIKEILVGPDSAIVSSMVNYSNMPPSSSPDRTPPFQGGDQGIEAPRGYQPQSRCCLAVTT